MYRYLKLYNIYLQRAIKSRLEYKKDAIVGIVSFLISNLVALLTLMFVVRSIPSLDGWSMYQLGFLYGFSMIPRALDHMLTDSLWYVGYWYVRTGIIDRFLIRPVNSLFQVIAEVFQPEAIGEFGLGFVLLIVCGSHITLNFTFGKVILCIIATIFGALIITSLKLLTCSVAFWTKRSGQLMNMVYSFADFAKYPISIYHPIIRMIMTFVFPFGLVISMPIDSVINNTYNTWLLCGGIIGISAVFMAISFTVWEIGIRNYESAGN